MNPGWIVAVTAAVFGCAAYFGTQSGAWAAARIVPFEDGPAPGRPNAILLIAGGALVGGLMASAGPENRYLLGAVPQPFDQLQLLAFAAIAYGLVACWYTDVRTGIVPDLFTLGPLAFAILVALLTRDVAHVSSMLLVTVPFAAAALFSRGRGMGWGDVKLVALGGATLGFFGAALAFSAACLVATGVAFARRRRSQPIAFAPYLIGSIATALAFPGILP